MDTGSGTQFTPCLEDFRQTVVDIPVSRNRLFVLKRYGGNVAEFCLQTLYNLFGKASEFHWWVLIWEVPHLRLLPRLGCTSPHYPGSALHSGHPTGTTFPYVKAVVKNASETSR